MRVGRGGGDMGEEGLLRPCILMSTCIIMRTEGVHQQGGLSKAGIPI